MRVKTPQLATRLLDAASRLFAVQHFHEVRMEDIADEAEVGKGTLYRYFHTKDDLYLKLLERAAEEYLVRLREAAASAVGARAQLVAVVDAIISYFDEQPHLIDMIQRAEVERGRGPGFPWQEARAEVFRLVGELFDQGCARGEFHLAEPRLTMMLLLGGLRTVLRYMPPPRPAGFAEKIVASVLK